PMNAHGFITTFTFFVRTYFWRMSGKTCVSNCWQIGHWRSMYSVSVTEAKGQPSVVPTCGMPLNSAATSLEPGRPLARLPTAAWFFGRPLLLPWLRTTARTIATAATATIPPAIASARGDAWRDREPPAPPFDLTGGGVRTCVFRASL